mmetsp:Transcript_184124/g.583891  ORF Transcript_184124/g.583891 Transcript_184124/m.583891 type:complete len:239 (-) Transcript_184124:23-739(-)
MRRRHRCHGAPENAAEVGRLNCRHAPHGSTDDLAAEAALPREGAPARDRLEEWRPRRALPARVALRARPRPAGPGPRAANADADQRQRRQRSRFGRGAARLGPQGTQRLPASAMEGRLVPEALQQLKSDVNPLQACLSVLCQPQHRCVAPSEAEQPLKFVLRRGFPAANTLAVATAATHRAVREKTDDKGKLRLRSTVCGEKPQQIPARQGSQRVEATTLRASAGIPGHLRRRALPQI